MEHALGLAGDIRGTLHQLVADLPAINGIPCLVIRAKRTLGRLKAIHSQIHSRLILCNILAARLDIVFDVSLTGLHSVVCMDVPNAISLLMVIHHDILDLDMGV